MTNGGTVALATALRQELEVIDTAIVAANIRRDAIMVLLDLSKPTFNADMAKAQAVQPKRAKPTSATKGSRPSLRATISDDTIREVRKMAAQGWDSQADIAAYFKLKKSTVSNIIRKKSWFATVE